MSATAKDQRVASSHKRETARRMPPTALLAGSLAVLATGAAVTIGVLGSSAPAADLIAKDSSRAAAGSVGQVTREHDLPVISRGGNGADRAAAPPLTGVEALMAQPAVDAAIARAKTKLWTTSTLNLWTRPDKQAHLVGELEEGKKVLVTGRKFGERSEVVLKGQSRWVSTGYFTNEKPPTLGGACTNGTSVESGVSDNIVKVHEAVCSNFPEISVYGTLRGGGGDHPQGKAVDIMVSGPRGWEIAEFVRANASALGVSYVIYEQKIWSVERGGEGWRGMSNRGSATANHFDHVHVSTY